MKKITVLLVIISLLLIPKNVESKSGALSVPFYIYNAASQFNLDAALLYSICKIESQCKPNAINRNDGTAEEKAAGIKVVSYGLFQIKVETAKRLGFVDKRVSYVEKSRHGHTVRVRTEIDFTKDLRKPEINAYYAAKLLRHLYNKYGDDTNRILSAYNAGHPIKGNVEYVNKVAREYLKAKIDKRF